MKKLTTLQFKTVNDFDKNLENLISLYKKSDSFLVAAPEVCLTGFCYERMDEADIFGKESLKKLLAIVDKKALVLTLIEKRDDGFYNCVKVIHSGKIIHEQTKHMLFLLGSENHHFKSGSINDIKVFKINDIKIAVIVCFEVRFTDIWKRVEDADIILVPAMWGKPRAEHLVTLTKALAIINRAYVVVSNSANDDMARESSVITPWGIRTYDNNKELIEQVFDEKEIKKMKRAIPYE